MYFQPYLFFTFIAWAVIVSKMNKNISIDNSSQVLDECEPYCVDSANNLAFSSSLAITSIFNLMLQ